eukprot:GAFH01002164.1.p3 GENE.GAFH01002164.1~~GAFH01002164.1.p3  ORF type:complete len:213 (-),score=75.09 GAFH01002164.1:56-694(-)
MDYEFRAWVSEGKLTAISSYDHYALYRHLGPQVAHIKELILAYWRQCHPHMPPEYHGTYVVDFGYLPQQDRVVLIELSPFLPCTGAALFHWKRDWDLLTRGDPTAPDGVVFRTREVYYGAIPPSSPESRVIPPEELLHTLVQSNWVERFESRAPLWSLYMKRWLQAPAAPATKRDPKKKRPTGAVTAWAGAAVLGLGALLVAWLVKGGHHHA